MTAIPKMVHHFKRDGLLSMKHIERLGCNYKEILTKEKGIDIVVPDIPLLAPRPAKDLVGISLSGIVLQILSIVLRRNGSASASAKPRGLQQPSNAALRYARGNLLCLSCKT